MAAEEVVHRAHVFVGIIKGMAGGGGTRGGHTGVNKGGQVQL